MKLIITVSVVLFSSLGGWLGSMLDGGNMFGGWSILFSVVGSVIGIWAGYKAGRNWLG